MNKRQRKKAISKFYNSGARLTSSDKTYLSKYFGVKIIMSGQEISSAMKQLGKSIVTLVDNFTPMLKEALAQLNEVIINETPETP